MATLQLDHHDTFLGYPTALLPSMYTVSSGVIALDAQVGSPFQGQSVLTAGVNLYNGFRGGPSAYILAGYKGRITSIDGTQLLSMMTIAFSSKLLLRTRAGGYLEVHSPPTLLGTSNSGLIQQDVTYMVEVAAFFGNPGSIEVRVNGLRVPQLTTVDWLADLSGQPQGMLAQPNLTTSPNPSFVNFSPNSNLVLGYVYQKVGTSLWKSVATGTALYSDLSDFHGDGVRTRLPVTGDGATYPITAVGSRWGFGGSGAPATVAAACGETQVDSDVGYVVDSTAPTGSALDRISFDCANLPSTASRVIAIQRNIVARGSAIASARLKSGLVSPAAATPSATYVRDIDPDPSAAGADLTHQLVNGQFKTFRLPYSQLPYSVGGTTILTRTRVNELEPATELFAMSP